MFWSKSNPKWNDDIVKNLVNRHQPNGEENAPKINSSSTSTVTLPFGRYEYNRYFSSLHPLPLVNKRSLDYETAKCKGAKLYDMIKAAYQDQTTSSIDVSSIDNGWDRDDDTGGIDVRWDDFFKETFQGKVPTKSESLWINLRQNKPYKNAKGEQINLNERAGGYYDVAYVPSFSTIVALNMQSPKSHLIEVSHGQISEQEILRRLPPLNRFSDVIWAVWNTVSKTPHDLRYLAHDTVTNEDTKDIMRFIFNKGPAKGLINWPGLTFGADQDEGLALLGTPNGLGTAWLLIDRAKELGPRLPRVTIFSPFPETGGSFRMVWDMRYVDAT
ncbi:MAG: hypothetical protein LQ343_006637 [Gyalolechia ehrenbergii]|nr:MAG: hypothetical protein LQ343_006637 [Gyalolechia ehrenbergii]